MEKKQKPFEVYTTNDYSIVYGEFAKLSSDLKGSKFTMKKVGTFTNKNEAIEKANSIKMNCPTASLLMPSSKTDVCEVIVAKKPEGFYYTRQVQNIFSNSVIKEKSRMIR